MVFTRRPPSTRRPARAAVAVRRAVEAMAAIEPLETRRLMAAVTSLSQLASQEQVTTVIAPVLADTATPASNSVTLASHFTDPLIPGTVATFETTEGEVVVALTDQATPNTVADFLNYANAGDYNGTIFHRSVVLSTGAGGSAAAPADIVQGGGYNFSSSGLTHIATNAPVADEFTSETFGDLAGTIALGNTGSPDTGASEFYFNVHDNTAALDEDATGAPDLRYTVFGAVLSGQDTTVSTIAALPTASVGNGMFPTLPLQGVTAAQVSAGSFTESNLVYTNSVTAVAGTTYTATSDDPALVTPTVTDGVLSFAYGAGSGVADITVTATNYDKTTASTTFPVTVPGTVATPTAVPYTAPAVVTGQSVTFNPLSTDTSTAAAAFNPATETVTTAPAHGTATVNPASGQITYTPTAGYTGTDTLAYTIADTAGAVSNPATVTLTAVPTAAVVSLGGTNPSVINLTEPDGTTASIRFFNATGTVTFANYQVTATKVGAAYTVSGAGATIDAISMADDRPIALSSLYITSSKPISVGSIYNADAMNMISAPTTTVTGSLGVSGGHSGGVSYVSLAALDGATVNLVNKLVTGTKLYVPTITDSTVTAVNLAVFQTSSVTAADPSAHPFTAATISKMVVTGTFAVPLTLTGKGYDVIVATVANPAAAWNLSGSIYHATVTNPTGAWNLTAAGVVQNLMVTGNLTSTVEVAAINQASVTGNLSGAVVQTTAAYNARSTNLRSLKVGGTISDSVVFAAGNVGTVSAGAISGSRIYAGTTLAIASNSALPTATTDLTGPAKITAVLLPTGGSFSTSEVAADQIGTLRLGTLQTTAGGTAFGIAGHKIASVQATLGGSALRLAGPQLKTAATLAAYVAAQKLTLNNFTIGLF